jgi:hypothetical protein
MLRSERFKRATAKLQAVREGGPPDEMVAAECRVLDRLLALPTADAVEELVRPALDLGYRGIEISDADDFFNLNHPWISAEVARIKAACPGLALDVRRWCVSITLADHDDLADHDHPGDIMPWPVARLVACPAMPSEVDGVLPPDLLRMVCCPWRAELALVARAWRAALRPVVGPQVVEGLGWATWILPLPAGEWVAGSVTREWVTRCYSPDVLARVARAWRRPPSVTTRGFLGSPAVWTAGRRPMRVGPCAADLELALETQPTDLHVVDYYMTDVAHRVDLLAQWPAGLEELHVHGDANVWLGLVYDDWMRTIDLVGEKYSSRGQGSRFDLIWRAPDATDAR